MIRKLGYIALGAVFMAGSLVPPGYALLTAAAGGLAFDLPQPGARVTLTAPYQPAVVRGLTVDPEKPLEFNFLIDQGENTLQGQALREEAAKLIKYFLASLTVPEKELWVNLSPYEKDRVISDTFGKTEMGRDLLAQDYMLKQLTGSVMIPEEGLGKEFWDQVYQQARDQFGTSDVPMDTFNKIWVVPSKAVLYAKGNTVVVVESYLKVMLDTDYIAMSNNSMPAGGHVAPQGYVSPGTLPSEPALNVQAPQGSSPLPSTAALTTRIMREVLVPAIEKEVNEGKTFARLRQIYNSVILAAWYRKNLRASLLGQVYTDQGRVKGVDQTDDTLNQKIYAQYVEAFRKGVYNLIREEYDPAAGSTVPRKYFTGGNDFSQTGEVIEDVPVLDATQQKSLEEQKLVSVETGLQAQRQPGAVQKTGPDGAQVSIVAKHVKMEGRGEMFEAVTRRLMATRDSKISNIIVITRRQGAYRFAQWNKDDSDLFQAINRVRQEAAEDENWREFDFWLVHEDNMPDHVKILVVVPTFQAEDQEYILSLVTAKMEKTRAFGRQQLQEVLLGEFITPEERKSFLKKLEKYEQYGDRSVGNLIKKKMNEIGSVWVNRNALKIDEKDFSRRSRIGSMPVSPRMVQEALTVLVKEDEADREKRPLRIVLKSSQAAHKTYDPSQLTKIGNVAMENFEDMFDQKIDQYKDNIKNVMVMRQDMRDGPYRIDYREGSKNDRREAIKKVSAEARFNHWRRVEFWLFHEENMPDDVNILIILSAGQAKEQDQILAKVSDKMKEAREIAQKVLKVVLAGLFSREELRVFLKNFDDQQQRELGRKIARINLMMEKQNRKPAAGYMIKNALMELVGQDNAGLGGIDLNPDLADMQVKGDGTSNPILVGSQPVRDGDIQGFIPVIINITPVHDVLKLLGI